MNMNTPLGEQLLKLRERAIENGMKTLTEDEINFSLDSRFVGSNITIVESPKFVCDKHGELITAFFVGDHAYCMKCIDELLFKSIGPLKTNEIT
jgi:hypothetical protein